VTCSARRRIAGVFVVDMNVPPESGEISLGRRR
jgi:hypothetical protein